MSEKPLTYEDLAERWGVCVRQAKRTCRRIGLAAMDLGHRTKRFTVNAVAAAEERASAKNQKGRRR